MEEEMKDLSMCCVCFEAYDELQRKPKVSSVSPHLKIASNVSRYDITSETLEIILIQQLISCTVFQDMVPPLARQLTFPKCKRVSTLCQQEAENLTTNTYALNLIRMKKMLKKQQ